MHWDLFCRVIDNHGDLGVCWRLARDLAARGESVRLWVDDARALDWMAPPPWPVGVTVMPWPPDGAANDSRPGDVVVEAFGCDPPAAFVAAMADRQPAPLWINLEYLSAEAYVERSHGLPSPQQSGPGAGLTKWFFFPGFTARTGGLLREPGLMLRRAAFSRDRWLAGAGWHRAANEQVALLFGYPGAPLAALLDGLASRPTLLLAAPGALREDLLSLPARPGLRIAALPWLPQAEFDHALWAADLNLVRGEDSFLRAHWAGTPLLWQIYPQHDGAHGPKLRSWLGAQAGTRDTAVAAAAEAPEWAAWCRWTLAWNRLAPPPAAGEPGADLWALADAIRPAAAAWRGHLAAQPDLTTQLLAFAQGKATPHAS